MKLNAHIPPESWAATVAHRALMGAAARRLSGNGHPRADAVARALGSTARGRATAGERDRLARVEARRAEVPFAMAASGTRFGIVPGDGDADGNGPGGGAPGPHPSDAELLGQAWEICRWTCIPPVWGHFLMRLVRELVPSSCLELGTGVGLSGAYQGSALELNGTGHLVTVDAHEAARIAERGFAELGLDRRVELCFGRIEDVLPEVVDRIAPIDYALLDAEHSEGATIEHFDAVLPHLADGAVVVLDDITQTAEMRRAWRTIATRKRVSLAVGLRRVGVVAISAPR